MLNHFCVYFFIKNNIEERQNLSPQSFLHLFIIVLLMGWHAQHVPERKKSACWNFPDNVNSSVLQCRSHCLGDEVSFLLEEFSDWLNTLFVLQCSIWKHLALLTAAYLQSLQWSLQLVTTARQLSVLGNKCPLWKLSQQWYI